MARKKQKQDEPKVGEIEISAADPENSDDSGIGEDLIDANVECDENLAAKNSNDEGNSSDDFAPRFGTESENADLTEQKNPEILIMIHLKKSALKEATMNLIRLHLICILMRISNQEINVHYVCKEEFIHFGKK